MNETKTDSGASAESRKITVYSAARLGMAIARATGDPVHMTVGVAAAAGLLVHERFASQGREITVVNVL